MLIVGSRVQESAPAAPVVYEDHVEIAVRARGLSKQTFHRIPTVETCSALSSIFVDPDYLHIMPGGIFTYALALILDR
jgi:hypothetical protein